MYLLIDIGNTRIKIGLARQGCATREATTLAYAHHEIHHLQTWLHNQAGILTGAYGVCVADTAVREQVEQYLDELTIRATWLTGADPFPLLLNGYEHPHLLGADRWLSAIGLLHQADTHAHSFVHASFGTATTVDSILFNENQQHHDFEGGVILPGPQLMGQALALNTAQLNVGTSNVDIFPKHTQSAISTGITAAQVGAVMRQWLFTYEHSPSVPWLFGSGGASAMVREELEHAFAQQISQLSVPEAHLIWCDTPTLDGLASMAYYRHP